MAAPLRRRGAKDGGAGLPAGRLPPGQYVSRGWPVLHYGKVPRFDERTWDLTVGGATADGRRIRWDWAAFSRLPTTEVTADLHCVTRFSVLDNRWTGVAASVLLDLAPPASGVSSVLVSADYGYSANLPLEDLTTRGAVLATHRNGERLSPEHGFPVRLVVPHRYAWKGPKWVRAVEYVTEDRPGFWEQRGYHTRADPWREQRYAHQDAEGDRRARD